MSPTPISPNEDPSWPLEKALIEQFLHERGYTRETVRYLAPEAARRLIADATRAAAQRLTEIECRAHWVEGVHRH